MMNKRVQWILWAGLVVILAFYPKIFGIYYHQLVCDFRHLCPLFRLF